MWLNFNSVFNLINFFFLALCPLLNSLLFFLKNFPHLFGNFHFVVLSCCRIILLKILQNRLEMITEGIQMESFVPIFFWKYPANFFKVYLSSFESIIKLIFHFTIWQFKSWLSFLGHLIFQNICHIISWHYQLF